MKTNFKQLNRTQFHSYIGELGLETYRAEQIIDWIYEKLAISFDDMTNLPIKLRAKLNEIALLNNINLLKNIKSVDGTEKFLFQLDDGGTIESVLIPNVRGKALYTLCISSQVGCAMGCKFCETGKLGLIRNLKTHEIIDQVLSVQRYLKKTSLSSETASSPQVNNDYAGRQIANIVFMGMGEPLNNFSEVMTALEIITDFIGFSKRKVTLSTSGLVPGIKKLPYNGPLVNLAVSLNATTDRTRNVIMPVNKKYPIQALLQACREFPLPLNRQITFEYVLLGGINDSSDDALRLVRLLKGIRSKINLIPFNPPDSSSEFIKPDENKVLEFYDLLSKAGMTVIVRKSSGDDISAACGQLRANYINN
jgi:23S rRNA (adenine2503-C2)-methyltransferase